MNRRSLHILLILFLCQAAAFAQLDSIQKLPEVVLTDAKLIHFSEGFKVEKLQDSLIYRNATSLAETLRYNSSIYFKENGFGMVSSPSFRGTNAAQTAVIWNGININSNFTGQTDFNTISALNYNDIAIRSGGGGVQYGSGAVGGSIHLNNDFSFKNANISSLEFQYGSFSTISGNVSTTQSTDISYLNIGVDLVNSENDYDYVGKNQKNSHGQFTRFSANLNAAKKLKLGNVSWNSEYSYNDRNFSGSLNTIGKDAYKDINTRNLWQLHQKFGVFNSTASFAHLFEEYRYYPDSEKYQYDGGKANTLIGSLQTEVFILKKLRLNGKVEYDYVHAKGSNVGDNSRKTLAAVVLLNHIISNQLSYGFNVRKEFLNDFDNPFLFSADAKWNVSKNYGLRLNGSKNYRIPTFNDLYWYAGGNYELNPETSYQVELGQEFYLGKLKADVATYFISSKDLIKWIPGSGGLWIPVNISKTNNYGVEVNLDYAIMFNTQNKLSLNANYSYTKAEDLQKNKQLIYVPYHKAAGTLEYNLKSFTTYFQGIFNGEAFTTTDNSEIVKSYSVFNLGMEYTLPSTPQIKFGSRLKNVFNTYYVNVAYRPMPSRSIEMFLNFNI